MIERFARLAARPEELRGLLGDVAGWRSWMPGVEDLTVVESSGTRRVVDVRLRQMDRAFDLRMEVERTASGLRQRQLSGWFRKWDGEWRILSAPDGGATLALRLEIELPGLARLAPASSIRSAVDGFFDDIVAAAEARLRGTKPPTPPPQKTPDSFRLELYETPGGIEVLWNGRWYRLRAD